MYNFWGQPTHPLSEASANRTSMVAQSMAQDLDSFSCPPASLLPPNNSTYPLPTTPKPHPNKLMTNGLTPIAPPLEISSSTNSYPIPPQCLAGLQIYKGAQEEFQRIRKAHRTLAPTGCTADFCQSGRATRLNEPRVGRDRPLAEVQREAIEFLQECRDEGVISSNEELGDRIKTALVEIMQTSIETTVTDINGQQSVGIAGGVWEQTAEEIEYGLRAAWKNARRCIMRSEFERLLLCDLRHVTTSREMAQTVIEGMIGAFNRGRILPTVFLFPPRRPGTRGPMLWNTQIMAFAGYRQKDGSILGDPGNVELTSSMIDLGWKPPVEKSKWDLLPIVTMANGEAPYMTELPSELKRTVQIIHPRYEQEFRDMDLRWVLAPALSRLGFDLGGNQYTASPFIGWFMDAEIGVRNLADSFRYNVLPEIVRRLRLSDDPDTSFEDLPEYMRLAALSRAQAELNFAVYNSYMKDQVMMIDSLTSSMEYQNFDQERRDEKGYRLPADPYWLSPPQGSIIPVWHSGAAPNYQPKPMICRHVQDPVKAWQREFPDQVRSSTNRLLEETEELNSVRSKVKIFTCSGGINAGKLAHKLNQYLRRIVHDTRKPFEIESPRILNTLTLTEVDPEDVILIIASTTGRGEVPRNGAAFVKKYDSAEKIENGPRFSVFANGDSTYGDTYNACGKRVQEVMTQMGCRALLNHCFAGDTALNNPDWDSFNKWLEVINDLFRGSQENIELPASMMDMQEATTATVEMPTATLVKARRLNPKGMFQITLDLGGIHYQEMDHIKLLTPNFHSDIRRALKALNLEHDQPLEWHKEVAFVFLSRYVDLDQPFKTLKWYPVFDTLSEEEKEKLRGMKTVQLLETLTEFPTSEKVETICKDMASLTPRLYSVASCPAFQRDGNVIKEEDNETLVDIIVKVIPGGRFSGKFLFEAAVGTKLRFGLTSPDSWRLVQAQKPNAPLIAITTGSGIGPIRALLQRRLVDIERTCADGRQDEDLQRNVLADEAELNTVMGKFRRVSLQSLSRRTSFSDNASRIAAFHGDLRRYVAQSPTVSSPTTVKSPRSPLSPLYTRNRNAFPIDNNKKQRRPTIPQKPRHLISSTRGSINLFAGFKTEDADLMQQIIRPASQAGLFDTLEMVPTNPQKIRVQDRLLESEIKGKLSRLLKDPSCLVFVCANDLAAEGAAENLSTIVGTDIKEYLGERYIEEIFRG